MYFGSAVTLGSGVQLCNNVDIGFVRRCARTAVRGQTLPSGVLGRRYPWEIVRTRMLKDLGGGDSFIHPFVRIQSRLQRCAKEWAPRVARGR